MVFAQSCKPRAAGRLLYAFQPGRHKVNLGGAGGCPTFFQGGQHHLAWRARCPSSGQRMGRCKQAGFVWPGLLSLPGFTSYVVPGVPALLNTQLTVLFLSSCFLPSAAWPLSSQNPIQGEKLWFGHQTNPWGSIRALGHSLTEECAIGLSAYKYWYYNIKL